MSSFGLRETIENLTGFEPLIHGIKNPDDKLEMYKIESGPGRLVCAAHALVYLVMAVVVPIIGVITLIFSPLTPFFLGYLTGLKAKYEGKTQDDKTLGYPPIQSLLSYAEKDSYIPMGLVAGGGLLATFSTPGFILSFFRALAGATVHPGCFINKPTHLDF